MTTMEDTGVGYNDEEDKDANGGNDGYNDEEARTTSRTTTSNNNKASSANKTSLDLILPNDHVRQFVSFLHKRIDESLTHSSGGNFEQGRDGERRGTNPVYEIGNLYEKSFPVIS